MLFARNEEVWGDNERKRKHIQKNFLEKAK